MGWWPSRTNPDQTATFLLPFLRENLSDNHQETEPPSHQDTKRPRHRGFLCIWSLCLCALVVSCRAGSKRFYLINEAREYAPGPVRAKPMATAMIAALYSNPPEVSQ